MPQVTTKSLKLRMLLAAALLTLGTCLSACDSGGNQETAAQAAVKQFTTPQGRILVADQASNTISLIDVATRQAYGTVSTGQQPHHVVATPDGKEFWVSLYGENRVQIFDAQTLKEAGSADVGASNDDLTFDPQGKMCYISLGKDNAVAVVDVASRKMVQKVPVGTTPHGVKVTPDGKDLLTTNTADNTVSLLTLQPQAAVIATIKTGANPFEVTITNDSATAYVSNFLGDSISVVDIAAKKTVGYIRSGKQPAMLALQSSGAGQQIWVANTGSADAWLIDAATRKLVTRVPVGQGAHGVVITPSGTIFVTNSTDNTVTAIDAAQAKPVQTIQVGSNPNGLSFLPNPSGQ